MYRFFCRRSSPDANDNPELQLEDAQNYNNGPSSVSVGNPSLGTEYLPDAHIVDAATGNSGIPSVAEPMDTGTAIEDVGSLAQPAHEIDDMQPGTAIV
mmetsp:Transcript_12410/g.23765  ORF Transcript_12410/g.23765 Transcript_12410/m.23765 type:complete len:98 (-) Transcript_12410:206-499(-)